MPTWETTPVVTVYNVEGKVIWGPVRVASPTLVKELAGLLDRPINSPGLSLLHDGEVLQLDTDLGSLRCPVDLTVRYDPAEPFDGSFCRELVELAQSACDEWFFPGEVLAPQDLEVPGAEVVRTEVLGSHFLDDDSLSEDFPDCFAVECRLTVKIPDGSPLLLSGVAGDQVQLQLSMATLAGEEELPIVSDRVATGTVIDFTPGALLAECKVKLMFECPPYRFRPMVDGPVASLQRQHASKLVREGVSYQTGSVPQELADTLARLIDELRDGSPPDYHPGSNGVVRDIVHPSLYPYIEAFSRLSSSPVLPTGAGAGPPKPSEGHDMWGRPYEDSKYQWLPAEVSVSETGKCSFETYINNIDRDKNAPLYAALEELLGHCLPLLEASWAYGSSIEPATKDWEVAYDRKSSSVEPDSRQERTLRGRTVQVITKVVDYELPPGGRHEGAWHVEGMSHENIVATSEFILQKDDDICGGDLEFQRGFTAREGNSLIMGFPQMRPQSLDHFVLEGRVPLGYLPLPSGRLASWPNSHVHRVTELSNTGRKTATRRIVVFWLINPDVRIVSTKDVAPQQAAMSFEEACGHRLQLMEERRRHKQNWNLREVTLCEH